MRDPNHDARLRRGLYLVTPDDDDTTRLLRRVRPLLAHASCLQYRNKTATRAVRQAQAAALLPLCRAAGVPLIVNDDVEIVIATGADGVHLGDNDGAIGKARDELGPARLIGASCYDDFARAARAVTEGASYVAFGAFFPSPTKPHARHASPQLLREAAQLGVPRVAIGGITPDNARPLVAAGADLIAVISGVFDAPDPVQAARACQALFD